ncbi:hypothetical protein F511_02937 [Dorcoceras hygrometricum]|uniref:E3 ubiquitin-protein ligase RMA n=1 Tax=Dorcoceras hygrometricum TaxID=472368 RepID=A0A2Z7AQZ0_9LAMI|nr:hypothetical protein F511_02937 [Dorcoceras hygrometricum]
MDLDLNQRSSDSPLHKVPTSGPSLNEPGSCDSEIGDRIRFLEAVTGRAIEHRRNHQQQSSNADMAEKGKCWKSDSSQLVAKALEMDGGVAEEGCFYDCNICSEPARTPVVTCCGHLFCWACFYHMSYVDSTSKECPVCQGEVSDGSVIPVYGNGDAACELAAPPRPRARRVESVRRRGLDDVPVAEALRRIRIGIGAMDQ